LKHVIAKCVSYEIPEHSDILNSFEFGLQVIPDKLGQPKHLHVSFSKHYGSVGQLQLDNVDEHGAACRRDPATRIDTEAFLFA